MRGYFNKLPHFFILLCVVFIPIPFYLSGIQLIVTEFIFGKGTAWIASNWFGIKSINEGFSSDSAQLYVLILLLFLLSVVVGICLKNPNQKLQTTIRKISIYYLALMFLKYGCDKVFKGQFYLPEPNILYTPFGQLDKDILYWSTMGTSWGYNFFLGSIEVITAGFLLFKKTRTIGLLLAVGVMTQVVAINFCFDISVKLYSLFLLMLAIVGLSPQLSRLNTFFVKGEVTSLHAETSLFPPDKNRFRIALKSMVITLFIIEALYPYILNSNVNDDDAPRPYLHGAYEVIYDKETGIKRFFIHRDGYLIFQDNDDTMNDFKLEIDSKLHQFTIRDERLQTRHISCTWSSTDSTLTMENPFSDDKQLVGKTVDWRKLPVIKEHFH